MPPGEFSRPRRYKDDIAVPQLDLFYNNEQEFYENQMAIDASNGGYLLYRRIRGTPENPDIGITQLFFAGTFKGKYCRHCY